MNLLNTIRFCEEKNFDVQPVQEGKKFRFVIWKGGKVLKIGEKKYKNWKQGQKEVYQKLYKVLTNA